MHTYHHENALVLAHQSRKRTLYTHNHTRNKITRAQRQPTPRVPLRSETPRVSLVLRPERHTTLPCPQRSQISTASYPKYQLPHTIYRAKSTAKVPLAHDISRAPQCQLPPTPLGKLTDDDNFPPRQRATKWQPASNISIPGGITRETRAPTLPQSSA